MYPNEPARPVYDEQPAENAQPAQPVQPAEPVQPARPVEYRRAGAPPDEVPPAFRIAQVVYVIFGIVIALIIIRVILKALAASTAAGFTGFVYGITDPLVAPFQGIFATPTSSRGSVFEFSSIVAIIVYALVAWAIVRLIEVMSRRRPPATY
jgi:uncharacterized protein YggT (Ycf19 family)